jgi:hypothetical protein
MLVLHRHRVHRIPASRVVTIAMRPSANEAGWRETITYFCKSQEQFFDDGRDKAAALICLANFYFSKTRIAPAKPA